MRIAISTGGGDAPGLNAVIRAAVLSAIGRGWEVIGIRKGFAGLLGEDQCVTLTRESVRGIAHMGGTILRTTNRGNPFHYPVRQPDGSFVEINRFDELMENFHATRTTKFTCCRIVGCSGLGPSRRDRNAGTEKVEHSLRECGFGS